MLADAAPANAAAVLARHRRLGGAAGEAIPALFGFAIENGIQCIKDIPLGAAPLLWHPCAPPPIDTPHPLAQRLCLINGILLDAIQVVY